MSDPTESRRPQPQWIVRAAEPRDHEQIVAINVEILRETEGQKMAGFGVPSGSGSISSPSCRR